MKVYVLIAENGEYSDKWTSVLSVFVEENAANATVERFEAAKRAADVAFNERAGETKARGLSWWEGGYIESRDAANAEWKREMEALGLTENYADREARFEVVEVEFVGVVAS